MANKAELISQIEALENALTDSKVSFTPVDRELTNELLEKEITRLESLLDDDSDELNDELNKNDKSGPKSGSTVDEPENKTRRIAINHGVNIEITLNGQKSVLTSSGHHDLPEERAKAIIAENLGYFTD